MNLKLHIAFLSAGLLAAGSMVMVFFFGSLKPSGNLNQTAYAQIHACSVFCENTVYDRPPSQYFISVSR